MKKTILITGTSTGIGRTTALLFAKKGWNVIATMRTPEKEIELNKVENITVSHIDIEDAESIGKTINTAITEFGKIDVVVNNAAFGQFGPFEAITPEQARKQFDVNVLGTMNVIRAILPHFRANKDGMIVNISSAGGRIGLPLMSMYMASKFALEGFSESLSYELATQNIIVKIVEPGGVDTPFNTKAFGAFAHDPSITDYDDYVAGYNKVVSGMMDNVSSAEHIAEGVYAAVTDGTDNLRYVVGEDAKGWIKARTSMADTEYIKYMREFFRV